ncbi:MAG: hypothetical protein LUD81_04545 [Clostridiales bacterium]|nr:hypothetical protein [Clostridiales bacterium]
MGIFKRLLAVLPAVCITFQTAAFQSTAVFGAESVLSSGGWYETAYATWSDTDAENAVVSYKGENDDDYTEVDGELVRDIDGSSGRVDIPGLAAGKYEIKIVTSGNTTLTASVNVLEEDRSGYAFETRTLAEDNYDGISVGAYKADGTPKDNAAVIYVTEDNKNTVSYGGYTGIGQILGNARNLSQSTPLIIRFIGEITTTTWSLDSASKTITEVTKDDDGNSITPINYLQHTFTLYSTDTESDSSSNKYYGYTFVTDKNVTTTKSDIPNKSEVYAAETDDIEATDTFINMCYAKAASGKKQSGFRNITLEGIGTDAVISNWGFDFRYGNSVEVKNLTFKNYPEDACSTQYFSRVWVHRCSFYRGSNDCDLTYEGDKYAGDGSTDMNEDYNVTLSYNYYYGTKKTSLNGGSDSSLQYDYTYHHNYFHNCGSRLPLARYVNVHLYNNYTYTDSNFSTAQEGHTNTATAISARASAWIFSERNYYDGSASNTVFEAVDTGSSTGTGFIKSYGDSINGKCTYTSGSNILIASSRTETGTNSNSQHSSEATASGGYIDNFDTNSSYFYYSDGGTDVSYITDADTAKTDAVDYSGVLSEGVSYKDIMNSVSEDDSDENDDSGVITSEQTVTGSNYTDNSYFTVATTKTKEGYIRLSSGGTVSFTTGMDGAVVTVVGSHASSTDSTVRTLTLYDSDDSPVSGGVISYEMKADESTVTIPSSDTLSAGSYYLKASGELNITSITVSFPYVISGKATLTFDTAETISDDKTYCTYFTVLADSANTVTVESSSKTFEDALSFDYRMKSGGTTATDSSGLPTARAVKFSTTGAGIVQLCGIAAGSDGTRYAHVYNSDMSTKQGSLTVSSSTGETVSELIILPSVGTYYITFEKAVNLYAVNVVVGGVKTDSTGSGYILTDTTDSYIIAGITAEESELSDYSELSVSVEADNTEAVSTEVVYEKAVVDDFIITPAYLGDGYTYLYVVKISGSGGNTDFSYKTSLTEISSETDEEG